MLTTPQGNPSAPFLDANVTGKIKTNRAHLARLQAIGRLESKNATEQPPAE